jgi:hypothetical protein
MPHETLRLLGVLNNTPREEKKRTIDPHPYPHRSNAGLREPGPVGNLSSKGQGQAMLLETQHLEGKQTSFSVIITSTCLDPDSGSDMIAYQIRSRRAPGPSYPILRCLAASHSSICDNLADENCVVLGEPVWVFPWFT